MTYPEVLNAVRVALTPDTWTQHTSARNDRGQWVPPGAPDAVKFCLGAQVDRAMGPRLPEDDFGPEDALYGYLSSAIDLLDFAPRTFAYGEDEDTYNEPGIRVVRFNDNEYTTFGDVVAVVDKAIELASA